MSPVENFIYQFDGDQREVMLFLHKWLTKELRLKEKIRFKVPFYDHRTWICYLNPTKHGSVEFAFVRGNELSNEQRLLDHKGRKQVSSLEIKSLSELPRQALNEIVQEAILLDLAKPYTYKRKPK